MPLIASMSARKAFLRPSHDPDSRLQREDRRGGEVAGNPDPAALFLAQV